MKLIRTFIHNPSSIGKFYIYFNRLQKGVLNLSYVIRQQLLWCLVTNKMAYLGSDPVQCYWQCLFNCKVLLLTNISIRIDKLRRNSFPILIGIKYSILEYNQNFEVVFFLFFRYRRLQSRNEVPLPEKIE